jgi:hypothetical protein
MATVSGHLDPIIAWNYDMIKNTLTTFARVEIIIWDMDEIEMIDNIKINHGVIN